MLDLAIWNSTSNDKQQIQTASACWNDPDSNHAAKDNQKGIEAGKQITVYLQVVCLHANDKE